MDLEIIETKISQLMQESYQNHDVPVGCILLDSNGKIVAEGYNQRDKKLEISRHAEIVAIENLSRKIKTLNLSDYILVTNLEPCMMCLGAIIQSKIKHIYYYVDASKTGFINSNHTFDISKMSIHKLNRTFNNNIKISLKTFFEKLR